MSIELHDMAVRAEEAGYAELAARYRQDAQDIENAKGPEYFSANSAQKRAEELVIPEPSSEILEVYRLLTNKGFDVAPIVYVDKRKREVTHAVIETVVRPSYTDGTQTYYPNPDKKDPLADILERGRTGIEKGITVPDWVRHVPTTSRFAVSWDEIHNFVAPEVVRTIPNLAEAVTKGNLVLRVPTKFEFQFAGKTYPHFGEANSWEWLHDSARFDDRLVGGYRDYGGLGAVFDRPSDFRGGRIGFRLQVASSSQKLPR